MRLIPIYERHLQSSEVLPSPALPSPNSDSASNASISKRTTQGNKSSTGHVRRPKGIAQVPTHTVGLARERRAYLRATLALPVCVRTIAGRLETGLATLSTQDISSSGIFFLCPRRIEPGTPIEMEVTLVDKPSGRGTVRMRTQACVVRVERSQTPGWHGLAAAFDDITFIRDESFPSAQPEK